ncbi:hypothetical protein [Bradyrhizobium sp. RDT46]|uniref:hypothetical protein n=1 Tax=Bradyrhizobium sp. RDT46 TaxID=3341829 RepID=UPI0035C66245
MNYWRHIASERWRNSPVRLAELKEAGNRCRICFRPGTKASPIEAHHATYMHLGREQRGELLAVCRDCHEEVTTFLRRRGYQRKRARRADVPSLRDPRNSLVDPTSK